MTDQTAGSRNVVPWFRWASVAIAVLVVVQAFLAGRGFLFFKPSWIDAHEIVANIVFLVGLALLILAIVGSRRGLLDQTDLVLSAVMLVLIVAQIGLGYADKDAYNSTPMSLHWPNGVLITIVAMLLVGRSLPRRDE